jgi:hypothetical protein
MGNIILRMPPFMIRFFLWFYRRGKAYASDQRDCNPVYTPKLHCIL